MPRVFAVLGALACALAVIADAATAHGPDRHSAPAQTLLDTAVRYQLTHGLALLAVAALMRTVSTPGRLFTMSGLLFVAGLLLFSGMLTVRALVGGDALGVLVPFGGAAYIAGWLSLALAALRQLDSAWR